MKILISILATIISVSAAADYMSSSGLILKDDGSISYMTHRKALRACPRGTHLPTARELAEHAVSIGAVISDARNLPLAANLIQGKNPDGENEKFGYDTTNYRGSFRFSVWSSTFVGNSSRIAYGFAGHTGSLYMTYATGNTYHNSEAVICFQN